MERRIQADRRAAVEKRLRERRARQIGPDANVEQLIHDLEVHEVELEMQNEELRRVQAELEQSRQRYADLFDFAPVGYVSFDHGGAIHDINLTAANLFGAPRGRILNKLFSLYIHRDDVPVFSRHLRRVWESHRLESCELRLKHGMHWVQLESLLIEGARGSHCRTSIIDIHSRRAAEQQARLSERQLHLLFENAVEYAIFVMDVDGDITDWNSGAKRILGFSEDEVVGRSGKIIFTSEDVAAGIADHEFDTARREGFATDERWHVRKDGSRFWAAGVLTALRDETGRLAGYAKILRDSTERKLATQDRDLLLSQLEQEHAQLQAILSQMSSGVVIVDKNGNLISYNQRAESILGESIKGANIEVWYREYRVTHSDGRPYSLDTWPISRALRGETILSEEIELATEHWHRTWMITAAPVRAPNGTITAAVATFNDITESRRLQAEMVKASKLESVGVLAGGIAHDFNNLLTAILGNLYLAKLGLPADSEMHQALVDAENACMRASSLTQQLLTFARGGAPVRKPINTAALLRETVDFAARGAGVHCVFDVPDDLWTVEVDAGQIAQVVNNLVINAKQAMPQGGSIWLRARNETLPHSSRVPLKPGRYIRFSIEDEGIGIAPEQREKIFDPFFSTKPKGSGLGLTTSYWVVQKHQGHIMATPRDGGGTCMTVYLPASNLAAAAAPTDTSANIGGRILIMDDEAFVRESLARALRHFGYEVEAVDDGARAIESYRAARDSGRSFDLLILDLTVPGGVGGREVVERIRAFDPGVRALVSSGYSTDPVMANPTQYGFVATIAKPYQIDDLRRKLGELLKAPSAPPSQR